MRQSLRRTCCTSRIPTTRSSWTRRPNDTSRCSRAAGSARVTRSVVGVGIWRQGAARFQLNGAPLGDRQELCLKISMMAPGTSVKLKLLRDRQERDITVTLAESPAQTGERDWSGRICYAGTTVRHQWANLHRRSRSSSAFSRRQRGVVTDVKPAALHKRKVQRGDVIQGVDRKPIATTDQFQRAMRAAGNQPVLRLINRGGDHLYTVVPAQ
jgi:serine protease Do